MKVNLPITLTAADTKTRTLTGRIVTWGEEGFTSAGKTVFAKDSITIPKTTSRIASLISLLNLILRMIN
jgi:hypothetical protein